MGRKRVIAPATSVGVRRRGSVRVLAIGHCAGQVVGRLAGQRVRAVDVLDKLGEISPTLRRWRACNRVARDCEIVVAVIGLRFQVACTVVTLHARRVIDNTVPESVVIGGLGFARVGAGSPVVLVPLRHQTSAGIVEGIDTRVGSPV